MRVPINLASRPLENLRPLRTAVALASVAALLLAAVIVRNELRSRDEFRALIQQQDTLEASIENLSREQQELESWLSTPQAEQIRQRSGFLNSLILRKSLSWTQMFLDLEKIVPARARITSIRPSLGASQEADLTLTATSDGMAPLVQFLKNLEASPKFGAPAVGAQKYSTDRSEAGGVEIELTTRYLQASTASAAPPADAAGAESKPPAAASDEESTEAAAEESPEAPQPEGTKF